MQDLAIAILAAGVSLRMGSPKQLLIYRGKTLVQRALDVALTVQCRPILLVTNGLNQMKFDTASEAVTVLINSDYVEGISASIRTAVKHALSFPKVSGLLIMNCDQPFLDSQSLQSLIDAFRAGKIVASSFSGTVGSPVIFDKCFFPELLELTGDVGARSVIKKHADCLIILEMNGAQFDVDTPADYEKLLQS